MVTWPLGFVAGALVAGAALTRWQLSPLHALVYGAATAFLATGARDWAEARVGALLSGDEGVVGGGFLALGLDLAVGAVIGLLAAPLLGEGALAGIGAGAVLAGIWSAFLSWLLCGDAVDRVVDVMLGGTSPAAAEGPLLADGELLENRGQLDAALEKYRELTEHRPTELEPYLRAAGLLHRQGRAAEAAALLRQARARAQLTGGQQIVVGRQLAELAAGPLGDPTLAAAELAILARRFRGTPAGEAAERDLRELRGRVAASEVGTTPLDPR